MAVYIPTIFFVIALGYFLLFYGKREEDFWVLLGGVLVLFSSSIYLAVYGMQGVRDIQSQLVMAVNFMIASYYGLRGGYEFIASGYN